MFPITTTASGISTAFPDVCKTPTPAGPVPLPYPNIVNMNQASTGTCTKKLKIVGKPALTTVSVIPMSTGDEAGSAGGVVSSKIKGEGKFMKGSTKVKLEGNPAVYQTCMVGQNGKPYNISAGVHTAPSQAKVKVMS